MQQSARRAALSPAVLWRVAAFALDPQCITPTGPKGNILKADVLSFLGRSPPTPAPASAFAPAPAAGVQHVSLRFGEHDLRSLRRFVANVGLGMLDDLLAKALCHALAACTSPTLLAAIHRQGGAPLSRRLGAPLSEHGAPPRSADSVYLRLFLGTDAEEHGHPAAPVSASVRRTDDTCTIAIASHDPHLNHTLHARLLPTLTASIADPYLMLL